MIYKKDNPLRYQFNQSMSWSLIPTSKTDRILNNLINRANNYKLYNYVANFAAFTTFLVQCRLIYLSTCLFRRRFIRKRYNKDDFIQEITKPTLKIGVQPSSCPSSQVVSFSSWLIWDWWARHDILRAS